MKKKVGVILSIILIVLGVMSSGIVLLFGLFGSFVCGKPFYMISGSDGPIPTCVSIFSTDFVWPLLLGVGLILIGCLFMIFRRKKI